MKITKKVYVVTWFYSDGSAYDVVGVYAEQEAADRILQLLRQLSDTRQFVLHETVLETEA